MRDLQTWETVDRERSYRKVKKKMMVPLVILTSDDTDMFRNK